MRETIRLHYPDTTSSLAVGVMIELLQGEGVGRVIVGDTSGVEHVKLSDGYRFYVRRFAKPGAAQQPGIGQV